MTISKLHVLGLLTAPLAQAAFNAYPSPKFEAAAVAQQLGVSRHCFAYLYEKHPSTPSCICLSTLINDISLLEIKQSIARHPVPPVLLTSGFKINVCLKLFMIQLLLFCQYYIRC